jgi:spore germination cell wall hydrolase CwlJ-like protein
MPLALFGLALGGCVTAPPPQTAEVSLERPAVYSDRDKDCLVRAMYFEANRSSDDGLLALGTVVMNRVNSGIFPDTICGVVGQHRQFATGVLTRQLADRDRDRADRIAAQVLEGKRHPQVASAMYFHMAGLRFHYPGMHYVLVAGGNAFYERKRRERHGSDLSPGGYSPSEGDDFTQGNHFLLDASLPPDSSATSGLNDLFEDNHFALSMSPVTLDATANSPARPR